MRQVFCTSGLNESDFQFVKPGRHFIGSVRDSSLTGKFFRAKFITSSFSSGA